MEKCIVCGKPALIPERVGKVTFCKICSAKIQIPFWKNKFYLNIDDLREQKKIACDLASNKGAPIEAIEEIRNYFEKDEDAGFLCSIDGGCGQTLKVYKEYCVINTRKDKFPIDSISERYAKTIRGAEPTVGILNSRSTQDALLRGVLSGRLAKTGIRLATSMAFDAIRESAFPEKSNFHVFYGDNIVKYLEYNIEFRNADSDELGFLKFYNETTETLFFFGKEIGFSNKSLKEKMSLVYDIIQKNISDSISGTQASMEPRNVDFVEEIRKYKTLLDDGIITQEEFNIKKKELLKL